ncbi:MAG: prephenate dehydrogenase [Spirochaetaceae bacterium]|jgi:prephenate dehydrogenase|nr:prephenate dehydrogenase [Spirochaetaceae bacterium]
MQKLKTNAFERGKTVLSIETCTTGIVGLGLMGGAFAYALRDCKAQSILAYDISGETLASALKQGCIDEGFTTPQPMLCRCDLVFLCLAPSSLIRFMQEHIYSFKSGALLSDIAGIKGSIVAALESILRDDLDFIPGHPMTGSEKGGFAYAKNCSFKGKNYILTPLERNKPENLAFLKGLIRRFGFSRITETNPADHDRKIAFTSQLCHVIAAALIDCQSDTGITRFGGGSFEDLTRIAQLNAPLWAELFIENSAELLMRIEEFEGSLNTIKTLIADENRTALVTMLQAVRDRRAAMDS